MAQEVDPDRDLRVTVDVAELSALALHLAKASELASALLARHRLQATGPVLAAEAILQADIRHAIDDAGLFHRYFGTMGGTA